MTQLPPDYEILGVSLVGPPPLGTVHLPWNETLTVLYGPNGAGKSVILNGISRALGGGGRRGWAYLHVRITEDAEPLDWDTEYFTLDLVGAVTEWIQHDLMSPDGWSYVHDHGHDRTAHEELLASTDPFDAIAAAIRGQRDRLELGEALAGAVRRSRTVTLVATDERSWQILPSVQPHHSDDATTSFIAEAIDEWRLEGNHPQFTGGSEDWRRRVFPNEHDLHTILLGLSEPPPWVPVPVGIAGSLVTTWGPDAIALRDEPIDDLTQRYLFGADGKRAESFFDYDSDEQEGSRLIGVSGELSREIERIADLANQVLAEIVPGFPTVTPKIHSVPEWLEGRFFSWLATDPASGAEVPLSALSEAQRRWAALAIQAAIWASRHKSYYSAMLVDEPEQALHSQASATVAAQLVRFASENRMPVFVTSHSPAFLDQTDARLIHVFRDAAGVTRIQNLSETMSGNFDGSFVRLGLRRSDLFQIVRLFVVVEGEHDKAVLEELFGEELAGSHASILAMRGSHNAPAIFDSQLLVKFSDARLLTILDGRHDDAVARAWHRAKRYALSGDVPKAMSAFKNSTRNLHSDSEQVFKELALGVLEQGRWRDFELVWLRKPDIIYYLRTRDLHPDLEPWSELQPHYLATRRDREGIKDWLARTRDVKVTANLVRTAAAKLDEIPDDLLQIWEKLVHTAVEDPSA